jgi:hypothetical protein
MIYDGDEPLQPIHKISFIPMNVTRILTTMYGSPLDPNLLNFVNEWLRIFGTFPFPSYYDLPCNIHVADSSITYLFVEWTAQPAGKHILRVVTDLNDEVDESNEDNNEAWKEIYVKTKPDLAINPSDVTLSKENPRAGDQLKITAMVRNNGEADANAQLTFMVDGSLIHPIQQVKVPGEGVAKVSVNWLAREGDHTIVVTVDPANRVAEIKEDNNQATRAINVLKRGLDLNITSTRASPIFNAKSTIELTLSNLVETPIRNITLTWQNPEGLIKPTERSKQIFLKTLKAKDTITIPIDVTIDPRTALGSHPLLIYLTYSVPNTPMPLTTSTETSVQLTEVYDLVAALKFQEKLVPGGEGNLTIEIANMGNQEAKDLSLSVQSSSPLIEITPKTLKLGDLTSGRCFVRNFTAKIDKSILPGSYSMKLYIDYTDLYGQAHKVLQDVVLVVEKVLPTPPPEERPPIIKPARFVVRDLTISPTEAEPKEAITISVQVTNVGEEKGRYTVQLYVDDKAVDTKTVTLGGGESTRVTFEVVEEKAGVYDIEVAGLKGAFTVKEIPPTPQPWVLYIAIATIVAVALATILLRRRI